MEQNIKKNKKPFQFCLTCYKGGHNTNLCYKLKKETKKKKASPDKEMLILEYFCHKVCEVQFGYYELRMTNYLCAARAVFVNQELRRTEYVNHRMCELQYSNYDDRMSNYLLSICD
jgi:hypothetical protein